MLNLTLKKVLSKKQSTIKDFDVKTHSQNAEMFWALDVFCPVIDLTLVKIKVIYFATCFLTVI